MPELIAILALFISLLILFVNYRNQVERRHGEIAKLRSEFLQRLSTIHHRMMSIHMHMETARLELRRMPECDDKYNSIESMPRQIEILQNATKKLTLLQSGLEGLDTSKANRGNVLMAFQSAENDLHAVEGSISEVEKMALYVLSHIRSKLEEKDGQQAGRLGKAQQARSGDA